MGLLGVNKNVEMDLALEEGKVFQRSDKKRPGVAPGDRLVAHQVLVLILMYVYALSLRPSGNRRFYSIYSH